MPINHLHRTLSADRLVTVMNEHHTQVLPGMSRVEEAEELGPVPIL